MKDLLENLKDQHIAKSALYSKYIAECNAIREWNPTWKFLFVIIHLIAFVAAFKIFGSDILPEPLTTVAAIVAILIIGCSLIIPALSSESNQKIKHQWLQKAKMVADEINELEIQIKALSK